MVPTLYPRLFKAGSSFSIRVVFPESDLPTMEMTGGIVIDLVCSDHPSTALTPFRMDTLNNIRLLNNKTGKYRKNKLCWLEVIVKVLKGIVGERFKL